MLIPADLVLCLGAIRTTTSAGRVEAACANGFAGIPMWTSDYNEALGEGLSNAQMRAVRLAMVESITAWANGP